MKRNKLKILLTFIAVLLILSATAIFFIFLKNIEKVELKEGWVAWERDGLYFEYPEDFSLSYNHIGSASEITVHKTNAREVYDKCSEWYEMRGPDFPYDAFDHWKALTELETNGLTYENSELIAKLDPVDCLLSGHHENMQPYKVGELNGIVREFYRGSECCTFENFTKELTITNQYNEVYTIMVNASMNEPPQSERIPQGRWTDPELDAAPFSWANFPEKNQIADKIFASVRFE